MSNRPALSAPNNRVKRRRGPYRRNENEENDILEKFMIRNTSHKNDKQNIRARTNIDLRPVHHHDVNISTRGPNSNSCVTLEQTSNLQSALCDEDQSCQFSEDLPDLVSLRETSADAASHCSTAMEYHIDLQSSDDPSERFFFLISIC